MPWRILVIHLYCQWGLIISSQKLPEMISYLPRSLPTKEYWCFQGKALEEVDTSESPSVLKRKPLKNPSRGLRRSKIFSNPDNLWPKWRFYRRRYIRSVRDEILVRGFITKAHYETFLGSGAVGSQLENLQRTQSFKGFNQHSISAIIKATDPRKYKIQDAQ